MRRRPAQPRRARLATATLAGLVLLGSGGVLGCGGAPRRASDVRRELEASGLEEARETAPDLVVAARAAMEDVERAETAGDLDAAADHATRARLLGEAALAERERAQADAARLELEQRTIALEEQALRDEAEAREVEADTARLAAARAAREELIRALERAERDESHPLRRRRISVGDDAEVRRAALAIRERARLLAAAASAMGADSIALARVDELASRSAGVSSSMEALELAEDAHEAARAALATARRARPAPSPEEIAAAVEAIEQAGLHPMRFERGLGIELREMFRPASAAPTPSARGRIAEVARLLASLPHGPVVLEIDVAGMGEAATRIARQRGEWAREALVEAGVRAERVTWREPGATLPSPEAGERLRVVLVSYAQPPPEAPPPVAPAPEETLPAAHP